MRQINNREEFIDGCFAPAKKGILLSARQSTARAPKSYPSQTLVVFLSPPMESASPYEVKLVEATIDSSFTRYTPDKLVGDKTYDSNSLVQQLFKKRGAEVIAPHLRGDKKAPIQDSRKL